MNSQVFLHVKRHLLCSLKTCIENLHKVKLICKLSVNWFFHSAPKTVVVQENSCVQLQRHRTENPWRALSLPLCLLTWWGCCSSAGSHTGQNHGWCQKPLASTLNAGWGRWPPQEAGTGPERRAGSLQETALALLAHPAEYGPNQTIKKKEV